MLLLGPAESPKNWAGGQRRISKIRGRGQGNYQEYDRRSLCFVDKVFPVFTHAAFYLEVRQRGHQLIELSCGTGS